MGDTLTLTKELLGRLVAFDTPGYGASTPPAREPDKCWIA